MCYFVWYVAVLVVCFVGGGCLFPVRVDNCVLGFMLCFWEFCFEDLDLSVAFVLRFVGALWDWFRCRFCVFRWFC